MTVTFRFANVHNGTLTASWNDAAGISLAGNETLFTVTFTAKTMVLLLKLSD
ncbi:MAG: hypothetical protein IPP49_15635 [Saprospiraceae bacterium]|nr:hypothetical protein [Saprospiraceae bacterium]